MDDFRNTRIGVVNAARLLGVTVKEIKVAVQQGTPIKQGVALPAPLIRAGGNYQFYAGEILDCVQLIEATNETDQET